MTGDLQCCVVPFGMVLFLRSVSLLYYEYGLTMGRPQDSSCSAEVVGYDYLCLVDRGIDFCETLHPFREKCIMGFKLSQGIGIWGQADFYHPMHKHYTPMRNHQKCTGRMDFAK